MLLSRLQWVLFCLLGLAVSVFFGLPMECDAQVTWNGNGTSNLWSDAANWTGGTPPSHGGLQTVTLAGSLRPKLTVDSAWSILGLNVAAGAAAFTLGGSDLTLGTGGISQLSASGQTITNNVTLSGNQTFAATAGSLTLSGNLSLGNSTLTLSPSTSRTMTLSGILDGSGSVIKSGAGTVSLTKANTFSGGFQLNSGTVSLGNDAALGAGSLTLAGGTVSSTAARTLGNNATVSGTVAFGGQALTFNGASFVLGGNTTLNTAVTLTINSSVTESGGPRSLTKSGTGTLILNQTPTTTGAVTVSGGVLALGTGASLPSSALVLGGGTLAASGTINRTLGSGANQISFTSSGGFAAYGGCLTVSGITGVPVWGTTSGFLATGKALLFGSTLSAYAVTWTSPFSLGTANRTITVTDNTTSTNDRAIMSGVISGTGGIIKTGTGRLDLTASNDFTGQVLVQQGELAIPLIADAGTASPLGAGTGGNATISLGSGTSAAVLRYTGPAASSNRGFLLAGTTGGGTIAADGSGALSLSGNLSASVAGAKVLTLAGNSTAANVFGGNISNGSGTVAVTKSGTSLWVLQGNNTYTGNTTLSAGELRISGTSALGTGALLLTGGAISGNGTGTSAGNAFFINANTTFAGTAPLTLTGNGSITGSRTLTVSNTGGTTLSGAALSFSEPNVSRILTVTGNGNLTVSSPILAGSGTGPDGLTKSGNGTLTLNAANTYTGNTTLSAGVMVLGHDQAAGLGTLVLTAGTIQAGGGNRTVSIPAILGGNIVIGGSLPIAFSGLVTETSSRTLTVNNTATTTFQNMSLSNSTTNRTLTIAGSGNTIVQGVISNGSSAGSALTKTGTGTLTLNAANTYTGNTTLSAGVMVLGHDQAAGLGSLILTAGTVQAGGGNRTVSIPVILGGNIVIGGSLPIAFSGLVTQTSSRTLTVNNTATTTLQNISLSNSATNRTLTFAGSGNTVVQGVISNGSAAGSALTQSGSGTLVLSGANTYGGVTTVSAGTLEIQNDAALGSTAGATSVSSGAALALSNNITTSEAVTIRGTGISSTGAILNISGNNTILTTVTQGAASTITAQAGSKLKLAASTGNSLGGNYSLTMGGAGNIELTRALNIGALGLTKAGAGTVTLGWSGTNTAGSVAVNEGKLELLGSLGTGTLTVAAAGALMTSQGSVVAASAQIAGQHMLGPTVAQSTFTNGLAYMSGSTLLWKLAANTESGPGTNFDKILVTGGNLAVSAGSLLGLVFNSAGSTVVWSDAFWGSSHTWTALARSGAGSTTGNFTSVNTSPDSFGQLLASQRPGATFTVENLGGNLVVKYSIPEPSTALLLVAGAGLLVWGRHTRKKT